MTWIAFALFGTAGLLLARQIANRQISAPTKYPSSTRLELSTLQRTDGVPEDRC